MKASRKGLLLVVISGIVFGIMPSTVAYCYTQGATPVLMMLSRSVLFELVLLPIMLRTKNTWELYRKTWKQYYRQKTPCRNRTALWHFKYYHKT